MKIRKVAAFAALFLMIGGATGWSLCGAVDDWVNKQATSTQYPVKAGGMLLRGIHNIVESPVEIFYHPYDELKSRPEKGVGFFKGLGLGVWGTVDKIGYGSWDLLTALVPDYNGETSAHHHKIFKKK